MAPLTPTPATAPGHGGAVGEPPKAASRPLGGKYRGARPAVPRQVAVRGGSQRRAGPGRAGRGLEAGGGWGGAEGPRPAAGRGLLTGRPPRRRSREVPAAETAGSSVLCGLSRRFFKQNSCFVFCADLLLLREALLSSASNGTEVPAAVSVTSFPTLSDFITSVSAVNNQLIHIQRFTTRAVKERLTNWLHRVIQLAFTSVLLYS